MTKNAKTPCSAIAVNDAFHCVLPEVGLAGAFREIAERADRVPTDELIGFRLEDGTLCILMPSESLELPVLPAEPNALRIRTSHLFAGALRTVADLLEMGEYSRVEIRARARNGGAGQITFTPKR